MRNLLGIFLIFFLMAGQSFGDMHTNSGQNQSVISVTLTPPPIQVELETLSRTAEDIYNLAKVAKWNKIRKKLDALKKSEKAIRQLRNEENDFFSQRLRKKIDDLEQAVSAKNRKDTMSFANNITYLEVAMFGDLKTRTPTNVMLLDYCGRKLEILSEENDIDTMANLVVRMHLIWQNLIPQLVDKGDTKEIKKFSEIMKHLEIAKSPEEFNHLARQVLDEVDAIKNVFKKAPKSDGLQK